MKKIEMLTCNIPVVLDYNPLSTSLSIGYYIRCGSKDEPTEIEGMAHLIEHMRFKGTHKRSAREISEGADFIGANMNAYTDKEITSYYMTLLPEHAIKGLDILTDMILQSKFDEEELEKEKLVILEEIKMYEDIPEEHLHDLNCELVLKGSAVAHNILGTIESVKKIKRNQIIDFIKDNYTVNNMVISVSGNFTEKDIIENLEENFKNIIISKKVEQNSPFVYNIIDKKIIQNSSQVHLCINLSGISLSDEWIYHYHLISAILGGNMSSRLFQTVREEHGLAYTIYTYLTHYQEGGVFTIYAATSTENYQKAVDLIKSEMEKISLLGITDFELQKAKNQFLSERLIALESNKNKMSRNAISYLQYGKIIDISEIVQKVNEVTRREIEDLAKKIFVTSNYSTVLLGEFNEKSVC
ncbi:MAG: pitrilysin family protein [Fusobacteria bacterium]|nr:pitrilysin family protein [Fusobacteriota bacterium]